jgi:hypothetical protein
MAKAVEEEALGGGKKIGGGRHFGTTIAPSRLSSMSNFMDTAKKQRLLAKILMLLPHALL